MIVLRIGYAYDAQKAVKIYASGQIRLTNLFFRGEQLIKIYSGIVHQKFQ